MLSVIPGLALVSTHPGTLEQWNDGQFGAQNHAGLP